MAALLLSLWPWYWSQKLPAEVQGAGAVVFGILLGPERSSPELPGSSGEAPARYSSGRTTAVSSQRTLISLWDQGDFVVGVWVALLPVWVMPLRQAARCFAVVAGAHLAISAVGYALGLRRTVL